MHEKVSFWGKLASCQADTIEPVVSNDLHSNKNPGFVFSLKPVTAGTGSEFGLF